MILFLVHATDALNEATTIPGKIDLWLASLPAVAEGRTPREQIRDCKTPFRAFPIACAPLSERIARGSRT